VFRSLGGSAQRCSGFGYGGGASLYRRRLSKLIEATISEAPPRIVYLATFRHHHVCDVY